MRNFIITAAFFICYSVQSQMGIGIPNPHTSAILELSSKEKGLLLPRLTDAERNAIKQPALGLVIFNTEKNCIEICVGSGSGSGSGSNSVWHNLCGDNGIAVIDSYTCNTNETGGMILGVPVSGVSQTITARVSTPGSYAITTTANGITFSAAGHFTATGDQKVVLQASGVPVSDGFHSFTIDANGATCSFRRETMSNIVKGGSGKIWLSYNLGATAIPTSKIDVAQYGDYYQWGRENDGHQKKNSPTDKTKSPTDSPGHGFFILTTFNWEVSPSTTSWIGVTGKNNPCPSGFRIPTEQEWLDELRDSKITDSDTAYNSVLKLTVGGLREVNYGKFYKASVAGYYWTDTTVIGTSEKRKRAIHIETSATGIDQPRSHGENVRCIQD
ncbi:hypothetical protein B4N84_13495 [Flavobacterium sp. IR1]|nr:hypothetical protein B4N84_13495 [Flavobacterium sp. IR1]